MPHPTSETTAIRLVEPMPVLMGKRYGSMGWAADSALVIPLCTQESESIGLDYFFVLATFFVTSD